MARCSSTQIPFLSFSVFMNLSIRKWLCFLPTQPAMLSHTSAGEVIDFNRDVQPILSGHCIECHGPDSAARKGELPEALGLRGTGETSGARVR